MSVVTAPFTPAMPGPNSMRTPWSVLTSLDFIHIESSYALPPSVGTIWQTSSNAMSELPSNDRRNERFPEYFSCASKPICALREVLAKCHAYAGPVTSDSNPPSHTIEFLG